MLMRPELTDLLSMSHPVVVVTGDSGTGKSSILADHQIELSRGAAIAPPPVTCAFDSGALQVAILNGLVTALVTSMADRTAWRTIQNRLDTAGKEMVAEVGKSLAKAVTQEVMALVKARIGEHAGEGLAAFFKGLRRIRPLIYGEISSREAYQRRQAPGTAVRRGCHCAQTRRDSGYRRVPTADRG